MTGPFGVVWCEGLILMIDISQSGVVQRVHVLACVSWKYTCPRDGRLQELHLLCGEYNMPHLSLTVSAACHIMEEARQCASGQSSSSVG